MRQVMKRLLLARTMCSTMRTTDVVARLAGDEFIALLPVHPEEAQALRSVCVKRLLRPLFCIKASRSIANFGRYY